MDVTLLFRSLKLDLKLLRTCVNIDIALEKNVDKKVLLKRHFVFRKYILVSLANMIK